MTGVLIRRSSEDRDTQEECPVNTEDGSDACIDQGMPVIASKPPKGKKKWIPLLASGRTWPDQHLDLGFLASKTIRQ